MSSIWQFSALPYVISRDVEVPEYGLNAINATLTIQRLPTEPVGSTAVTFVGVHANSEIRVYLPDTTETAGVENCADDPVLSWSAYAPGSANNTVRIVIVHPDYKIKEFNYVSSVGNQSLPVQQEPDKWYSNP